MYSPVGEKRNIGDGRKGEDEMRKKRRWAGYRYAEMCAVKSEYNASDKR